MNERDGAPMLWDSAPDGGPLAEPRRSFTWRRCSTTGGLMLAGAVGAILVVAAVSWWDLGSNFTASGNLTLYDVATSRRGCVGGGTGGYADIRLGTQVVVTDSKRDIVGVGNLGLPTMAADGGCAFRWTVDGVPEGSRVYGLEVSGRGVVLVTAEDLRDGVSEQVLGDPDAFPHLQPSEPSSPDGSVIPDEPETSAPEQVPLDTDPTEQPTLGAAPPGRKDVQRLIDKALEDGGIDLSEADTIVNAGGACQGDSGAGYNCEAPRSG